MLSKLQLVHCVGKAEQVLQPIEQLTHVPPEDVNPSAQFRQEEGESADVHPWQESLHPIQTLLLTRISLFPQKGAQDSILALSVQNWALFEQSRGQTWQVSSTEKYDGLQMVLLKLVIWQLFSVWLEQQNLDWYRLSAVSYTHLTLPTTPYV